MRENLNARLRVVARGKIERWNLNAAAQVVPGNDDDDPKMRRRRAEEGKQNDGTGAPYRP